MEPPEKTDATPEDVKPKDLNVEDTSGGGIENIQDDDPKVDGRKLDDDVKVEVDMKIEHTKFDDAKMDDESDDSPIEMEDTPIGEEGTDEMIRERLQEQNGVKRVRNTRWSESETLTLIAAKHAEAQKHPNSIKRGGLNFQRKWVIMAERCKALGMQRSAHQLKKRWNSLHSNYVHIKEWQSQPGAPDFWSMDRKERMIHKLPAYFHDVIYKALEQPSSIVLPLRPITSSSNLVSLLEKTLKQAISSWLHMTHSSQSLSFLKMIAISFFFSQLVAKECNANNNKFVSISRLTNLLSPSGLIVLKCRVVQVEVRTLWIVLRTMTAPHFL
jgi:hypothetical protein